MRFELGAVRHVNDMCRYVINGGVLVVTASCDLTDAQTAIIARSVSERDRSGLAEKLLENCGENRRPRGRRIRGLASMRAIGHGGVPGWRGRWPRHGQDRVLRDLAVTRQCCRSVGGSLARGVGIYGGGARG